MILQRLRRVLLARRLVVEHLGRDYLVVRETVIAELVLRPVTCIAETRMRNIDAGIDDGDLDPIAFAASRRPCLRRADQRRIDVDNGRVIQAFVLGMLDLRRCRHLRERRAVELHRDRVQ